MHVFSHLSQGLIVAVISEEGLDGWVGLPSVEGTTLANRNPAGLEKRLPQGVGHSGATKTRMQVDRVLRRRTVKFCQRGQPTLNELGGNKSTQYRDQFSDRYRSGALRQGVEQIRDVVDPFNGREMVSRDM